MIDLSEIRKLSLGGNNQEIRSQLISKSGLKYYRFIFRMREATANQVSHQFGVSIQMASTTLNKLYEQQYLRRDEHVHESGGKEYTYFP